MNLNYYIHNINSGTQEAVHMHNQAIQPGWRKKHITTHLNP